MSLGADAFPMQPSDNSPNMAHPGWQPGREAEAKVPLSCAHVPAPQNCEVMNVCYLKPRSCVICYTAIHNEHTRARAFRILIFSRAIPEKSDQGESCGLFVSENRGPCV